MLRWRYAASRDPGSSDGQVGRPLSVGSGVRPAERVHRARWDPRGDGHAPRPIIALGWDPLSSGPSSTGTTHILAVVAVTEGDHRGDQDASGVLTLPRPAKQQPQSVDSGLVGFEDVAHAGP